MKALLVVDVQNGLVEKKLFRKDEFLKAIGNAIAAYRRHSDAVIFIQHNNNQLSAPGEPWKVFTGLDCRNSDTTIQKTHGNAFEHTGVRKRAAAGRYQ